MPERGNRSFSGNNIGSPPIREDYDEDEEFYVIGDRVLVDGYRAGSVAYFGETEFASGDWVGVVLDEPTGNHDGKLHGREYFQCAPNHGIFVRTHRVSQTTMLGKLSRKLRTPTPTYNQLSGGVGAGVGGNRWGASPTISSSSTPTPYSRCSSNRSPANSLLDSYYYDDDYRQDRGPTIDSLARKLRSIDEQQRRQQQQQDRSMSSTPAGILKHCKPTTGVSRGDRPSRWAGSSNSQSSGLGSSSQHDLTSAATSMSSRMDDLDRRLRASSMSPSAARRNNSVFNFRPKREPLSNDHARPGRTKHRSLDVDDDRAIDSTRVNFSTSKFPELGDRVWVRTERAEGELTGVLRFMGETEFATGEWAGVELDERVGKNDGSILGHRYFYCPPSHGLFVPLPRVRKCSTPDTLSRSLGKQRDQFNSFDTMRSTILSPPPVPRRWPHYEPMAPSRSSSSPATPSSYACQSSPLSSESPISIGRFGSSAAAAPEADDSWRQPPLEPPPVRTYVSRATSISPGSFDRGKSALLERHYNRTEKFDDRDLERELRRSSSNFDTNSKLLTSSRTARPPPRAKAVTYTFITNKLDGTPIAKRTLVYE